MPPRHLEHGPGETIRLTLQTTQSLQYRWANSEMVPKNTLREKRTHTVNPTGLKNLWNVCGDRVISLESEHGKVPQRWLSMIARNAHQYLSARDLFTVTVSTNPGEGNKEDLFVRRD